MSGNKSKSKIEKILSEFPEGTTLNGITMTPENAAAITGEVKEVIESVMPFDQTEIVTYNDQEMALGDAVELEIKRLEELLCDRTEAVTEADAVFKKANDEAKEKKEELSVRESLLWQTNRDLRLVLKGQWKPEKPDPQREFDFSNDESATLWKSKPIEELKLSKNINRILENEGFVSVGMMVAEIDGGLDFKCTELSENQIKSIKKTVAEFRSQLDGVA